MLVETAKNSGYFYVIDETKPWLGGNIHGGDPNCTSKELWDYLIEKYKIDSVLDVGCGEGIALSYFKRKGVEKVLGIEGLKENVEYCKNNQLFLRGCCPVIHLDLTKGKYKTYELFDMTYCFEVAEHIPIEHVDNLIETLCNGKIICMTAALPGQHGWAHTNLQPAYYWIDLIEKKGYKFSGIETDLARSMDQTSYFRTNGLIFHKKN